MGKYAYHRRAIAIPLVAAVALSSCQGAHQKAGRQADEAAAAASGKTLVGEGGREQLGAAEDRTEAAAREAQQAEAKALEKRAKLTRDSAEAEAEQMEQQAKLIRESLKKP